MPPKKDEAKPTGAAKVKATSGLIPEVQSQPDVVQPLPADPILDPLDDDERALVRDLAIHICVEVDHHRNPHAYVFGRPHWMGNIREARRAILVHRFMKERGE